MYKADNDPQPSVGDIKTVDVNNKEPVKTVPVVSKSFMALGPTLHYSHSNVQICWLLATTIYVLTCLVWSKITTGAFWSFQADTILSSQTWRLERFILTGVSIFEYPWQILVLGLLMGMLAVTPILIAQWMSLSYSIPFIVSVFFLANLPGFALSLLISCVGVACRPLRFRSRIIAVVLCMAPQLIYWGYYGSARGAEPVMWGFSFLPWVCAWLVGFVLAGVVLVIGHYTRYKPGLVWISTALLLILTVGLFEWAIGFDELAYQLYVAKNNPEQVAAFYDHSITHALDETITDPGFRGFLKEFFYPTDVIPLREELKREMQDLLRYDKWPSWFYNIPDELNYQQVRRYLNSQYDLFISPPKVWWLPQGIHDYLVKRRTTSQRMAVALYYKALLSEYAVDVTALGQQEILHFYSDYPQEGSREIWYRLYRRFGDRPESIEARWRIARHWAGQERFDLADALILEGKNMLERQLARLSREVPEKDTIFRLFHRPMDTVMTPVKLLELQTRLCRLQTLIGKENQCAGPESSQHLAQFVLLNPYSRDYARQLDVLQEQLDQKDCLRDNVRLAQITLVADEQSRAEQLTQLHRQYMDTDGGMKALYELGLLKIRRYQMADTPEHKKTSLAEARATLMSFVSLYPGSYLSEIIKNNLAHLPSVE